MTVLSITAVLPLATLGNTISDNSDEFTALAIFIGALIVARIADWLIGRNTKRVASGMTRSGEFSQVTVTRLRLVRRLVVATIIIVGFALALNQIDVLRPLGTALLASSAVVGIVIGFAARQTIANAVAGMMLAAVQPFRIGDVIEWQGNRGIVEDLTLTYTFVRLPSGHRLIVPNEEMAGSPLENYTIAARDVEATATISVAPARARRALDTLREKIAHANVVPGACDVDRAELNINFASDPENEARSTTEMREQALRILADADILLDGPPAG